MEEETYGERKRKQSGIESSQQQRDIKKIGEECEMRRTHP